jgi:hypothetical protein
MGTGQMSVTTQLFMSPGVILSMGSAGPQRTGLEGHGDV